MKMTDAQVTDNHRQRAAEIVGSLPDLSVQESLKRDIALNLARSEAAGWQTAMETARDGVRVLRLLEYVYPDTESAVKDQAHWYVQSSRRHGSGVWIRSTMLPLEVLD
jgi:hypothetical protein